MTEPSKAPRGIQSLDAALSLLGRLAASDGPISLSDLARECEMPPSKVHRYLSSFLHAGMVEQAGRSGKYDLGKGALKIGLAAIARHNFVNRASEALVELSQDTGLTALLSIWGDHGATVVRWERAPSPIVTSMGLGTILPALTSATGRAFLAWGPQRPMDVARDTELRRVQRASKSLPDIPATKEAVSELMATTRTKGFASVDGRYIPGLVAIAAPILDWQNEAQAVVTLIGTDPTQMEVGSKSTNHLIRFCRTQSVQT